MNIIMNYDVNFFIIYFFIEGCIGGWVFFVVICFLGFVDIMKVGKQRFFVFVILGFGVGVGFLVGILFLGYFIEVFGFNSFVIVFGVMVLVGIILMIFVFKELLSEENRVSFVYFLC